VRQEPGWDSSQTRALASRACFDCHSNETKWPWYSHVAPVSWLVQRDVELGRGTLNFSEWDRPQEGAEAVEAVQEGEMPPRIYLVAHPEARLPPAEYRQLVAGLAATFGKESHAGEAGEREDREED
jgi:hypothetical protein